LVPQGFWSIENNEDKLIILLPYRYIYPTENSIHTPIFGALRWTFWDTQDKASWSGWFFVLRKNLCEKRVRFTTSTALETLLPIGTGVVAVQEANYPISQIMPMEIAKNWKPVLSANS
jgi:hypothetical protein